MSNAGNPCFKLTVFGITALFNGHNHLDKSLLKDIFCEIFVMDYKVNVGVYATFVTIQQYIESSIITFCIKNDQLFVSHHF